MSLGPANRGQEAIPGAPEVIGHHIDEVHVPWVVGGRIQEKKNDPEEIIVSIPLPLKLLVPTECVVCNYIMKEYALLFFISFSLTFI